MIDYYFSMNSESGLTIIDKESGFIGIALLMDTLDKITKISLTNYADEEVDVNDPFVDNEELVNIVGPLGWEQKKLTFGTFTFERKIDELETERIRLREHYPNADGSINEEEMQKELVKNGNQSLTQEQILAVMLRAHKICEERKRYSLSYDRLVNAENQQNADSIEDLQNGASSIILRNGEVIKEYAHYSVQVGRSGVQSEHEVDEEIQDHVFKSVLEIKKDMLAVRDQVVSAKKAGHLKSLE